jgi:hypothetical protein
MKGLLRGMLKRVPLFSGQTIIAFRGIKTFKHPEQLNTSAALTGRKFASLPAKGICFYSSL